MGGLRGLAPGEILAWRAAKRLYAPGGPLEGHARQALFDERLNPNYVGLECAQGDGLRLAAASRAARRKVVAESGAKVKPRGADLCCAARASCAMPRRVSPGTALTMRATGEEGGGVGEAAGGAGAEGEGADGQGRSSDSRGPRAPRAAARDGAAPPAHRTAARGRAQGARRRACGVEGAHGAAAQGRGHGCPGSGPAMG